MADTFPPANADESVPERDRPLPTNDDPGGAHTKGYSADPRPAVPVPESDPIPRAPAPAATSQVHQPEKEGKVQPTGRGEGREHSPSDRPMAADR